MQYTGVDVSTSTVHPRTGRARGRDDYWLMPRPEKHLKKVLILSRRGLIPGCGRFPAVACFVSESVPFHLRPSGSTRLRSRSGPVSTTIKLNKCVFKRLTCFASWWNGGVGSVTLYNHVCQVPPLLRHIILFCPSAYHPSSSNNTNRSSNHASTTTRFLEN